MVAIIIMVRNVRKFMKKITVFQVNIFVKYSTKIYNFSLQAKSSNILQLRGCALIFCLKKC